MRSFHWLTIGALATGVVIAPVAKWGDRSFETGAATPGPLAAALSTTSPYRRLGEKAGSASTIETDAGATSHPFTDPGP